LNQVNSPKLSYRAEIDGLRAIALVSVILYHAQMVLFGRDWFEGGFIGVDIFFVISGYLITRIILSELQAKGSFSFLNFYERRARRILPMLFVVILASIPFAWQKLLPSDFVEYAESILASLFFGSNVFFYFSTTEYGADSSLLKPFLHTWSLGVEEQFYLVFPIIAIFAFKFFRQHFLTILVGLSLLSLQFAELMEVRNSDLNFYLPFSRFWELAVGSMLAYRELNYKTSHEGIGRRMLPMLGLYLIAYSILFFDSKTPHPSFYTLIPIVGVALIIGFASKDELVGKILGSRPFVWIGLISYSAYLWHFPIFAFSRMGKEPNNYDKFEWIALTLTLSLASFFLVERIFGNRKLISKKCLWVLLFLATTMTSVFMYYSIKSEGIWERYPRVQQELIKGFNKPEYRSLDHPLSLEGLKLRENKLSKNCNMRLPSDACRYGNEKLVFLGDSYVGHYERAFIDVLNVGFISFNYEQCPFVSDQIWFGSVKECSFVNEERRKIIKAFETMKIFVISANFSQFQSPKRRTDNPISDWRANRRNGERVNPSEAWESFSDNIDWLVSRGHKVIFIRSIPGRKVQGEKWLSANLKYINKMNFPAVLNDSRPSEIKAKDDRRFPSIESPSVLIVDPIDSLCDVKNDVCMDVIKDYGPVYNSGNHLSYLGASLVASSLERKLLELGWLSE
jgi:peptidoglycan/LPS O-acetylase OafA/YrhL